MKIETGITTQQEDSEVIKTIREQRFKSRFRFLNGHDGIRPGELTCLIGPKGGSKSTLARSIMLENAMQLKRTYAVLSEETVRTYRFELQRAAKNIAKVFEKDPDLIMENIFFTSLLGLEFSGFEEFKARFNKILDELNPEIVYFDNFTTSFICSLPFHYQAKAINYFKSIATERDIPFVLILHTVKGTDIYKRFVEGDDVRSDASSVNYGSYNYVISTFFRLKPPKSYIYIDKARYHSNMNKKVFELEFDNESGLFMRDKVSSLSEVRQSMESGSLKQGARF